MDDEYVIRTWREYCMFGWLTLTMRVARYFDSCDSVMDGEHDWSVQHLEEQDWE